MQKVTSTSAQVALNAAPTQTKGKLGTYDVSWANVKRPAGNSVLAKVANAVIETFKNIAKLAFNAVVWVPNKIHSLLYPNAANAVATPANDDDVTIEQDSVIISIYDSADAADQASAASDLPQADIVEIEEDLPEPVVSGRNRPWLKAAVITGAVATIGTGLLVAANRYDLKVPYFGTSIPGAKAVDTFLTQTVPGYGQAALGTISNFAANQKNAFCDYTTLCAGTSAPTPTPTPAPTLTPTPGGGAPASV